jgi:hypothetical protein
MAKYLLFIGALGLVANMLTILSRIIFSKDPTNPPSLRWFYPIPPLLALVSVGVFLTAWYGV